MDMMQPYYAVIFTSMKRQSATEYELTFERMKELSSQQPGFLGITIARNADGKGITVCYSDSLAAIKNWKMNSDHQFAQSMGKKEWYQYYSTRIAKVEEEYSWEIMYDRSTGILERSQEHLSRAERT